MAAAVLSSAYPVSIHERAVTAAQLVQRRPLPANHQAALAHSLDDLDGADLSRTFWREGHVVFFVVVRSSLNAHELIYFCLMWQLTFFTLPQQTAGNKQKVRC